MHWRNSDFQIRHFLAGKCHTADEAYRLLSELREERVRALANANTQMLVANWRLRWLRRLTWLPIVGERIAIEVARVEGDGPFVAQLVNACLHEIATIDVLLLEVRGQRRYADLSDAHAHQAAQRDEWREELIWRAENFFAAEQRIPHDHLATMRLHPDFGTHIWPRIVQIQGTLNRCAELAAKDDSMAKDAAAEALVGLLERRPAATPSSQTLLPRDG